MTVVYYTTADGIVRGSTSSEREVNVELELSHWGTGYAALVVPSADLVEGKIRKVVNGSLVYEDDLPYLARKAKREKDRREGLDNLKAGKPITDDQIAVLFRGA